MLIKIVKMRRRTENESINKQMVDEGNALYAGVNQASLARLMLVQNAAEHLLTGTP